ncbi:sulfurtransferase complex subunit TusB [Alteromonas sp. a30]|uniref:sulfurtransferase complex subunit TusB n=1 Tax=Alteromonas sp. a30 TaxID=2730917 RepID=UPI00227F6DAE|nr:sulfurtransferase complex subunit TusB [Alteromonas sp. a30]MCY7295121.1 sulfurtransferase complex subunit TusB [Alteromonas sp. a30]
MNLHILSKSVNTEALAEKLNYISEEDACLLRNDAVLMLLNEKALQTLSRSLPATRLFLLEDDLRLRGLAFNKEDVTKVGYNEFVDLCLQFEKTISW